MLMWYTVDSSTRLTVQPKRQTDTWPNHYSLQGDTLTMLTPRYRFFCTRARPEEVPEWFAERVARELAETWERLAPKDNT